MSPDHQPAINRAERRKQKFAKNKHRNMRLTPIVAKNTTTASIRVPRLRLNAKQTMQGD